MNQRCHRGLALPPRVRDAWFLKLSVGWLMPQSIWSAIWDQTLAASCRKVFVTRLQLTANAWLVLKIACLHAVPWSLGCCITSWGSGWYSFFRPRIWTSFCFTVHFYSCGTGGPCSHDGHLCSPSIKGTGGVPSKRLKLMGFVLL